MKAFKKLISLSVIATTIGSTVPLSSATYGGAYEDSYRASTISPTVLIGTVALATGIGILIHNRKRHSHHHHSNGGGSETGTGGSGHGHN